MYTYYIKAVRYNDIFIYLYFVVDQYSNALTLIIIILLFIDA